MTAFLILIGKLIAQFSRVMNLGHGSTWPGHIALSLDKNFIKDMLAKNPNLKIILIAGTNGKTTTAKLIQTILKKNGLRIFRNTSGANLLNGITSSLLLRSSILQKLSYDFAIFEVDENSLPLILKELTPNYLVLLNLFRDQLDRYGEVNTIANKWHSALRNLFPSTKLILNADDPQIAWLGLSSWSEAIGSDREDSISIKYFGLNDPKLGLSKQEHAVDSAYCPLCQTKLDYKTIYFSHLGDWECKNCKLKRPKLNNSTSPFFPLNGIYNRYNTIAAVLFANLNNINNVTIEQSLQSFKPAFGRGEKLKIDGKKVQLFLSKNPASFNQSLRTISEMPTSPQDEGAKNLLIVLNDRIPDGRDVSWIWDVDFEEYINEKTNIYISGDRYLDLALRIKYAQKNQKSKIKNQNCNLKFKIYEDLKEAIKKALDSTAANETLYILPTYSAMLETRKILTGKKIL